MDIRIAITQAKLEELYEDPNIPPEFGTLILMINTELRNCLEKLSNHSSSLSSSTSRLNLRVVGVGFSELYPVKCSR